MKKCEENELFKTNLQSLSNNDAKVRSHCVQSAVVLKRWQMGTCRTKTWFDSALSQDLGTRPINLSNYSFPEQLSSRWMDVEAGTLSFVDACTKTQSTQSLNDVGIPYDGHPESNVIAAFVFCLYELKDLDPSRDTVRSMKLLDICYKKTNKKSNSELARDLVELSALAEYARHLRTGSEAEFRLDDHQHDSIAQRKAVQELRDQLSEQHIIGRKRRRVQSSWYVILHVIKIKEI